MSQRATGQPTPRFSVSQLPPEIDPAEKDFARLLTQALAPSFVLVKRLGAGGMGAVYLARDPVLRRLVAVKVLAPNLASDPEARARFEREGQAVAAISHPNVVNVHSVGELENGVPYIVMQYVEGRTLAERLKEDGPLEAKPAKNIVGEVASALAAAHKKGIIHRDIKPANIILDEDTGRAMVTDFGIAAVKREEVSTQVDLTQAGMAIGTPAYMSPEQLLAEPVTDKTDIYSLGLLAYELFIAQGPYQVSSPQEMMAAHLRDAPRRLSTMRGDVEPEFERLIENCLAKDPKRRPTAAEVEHRLEHGASVLLEWPPPGLEPMRAELTDVIRLMLAGALAAGIPVVLLSVFDHQSFVRQSLPPGMMLLALATLGILAFSVGLYALEKFISHGSRAVAAGYGWGTILEVAADRRGDTGALIAGAREYAELTPSQRNTMRRNRLFALIFRLLAALAPVVGYFLGVLFSAGSPQGPTIVLWSSLLLSFTLLAASWLVWKQEERAMKEPRRRLRTAHAKTGAADKIAESWVNAFNQVRLGQRMGVGARWHGRRLWWTTISVSTLITMLGVGIYLTFLLTSLVGVAGAVAAPYFGNTIIRYDRIKRIAEFRLPTDSGITPLRAGQAMYAILRNGPGGALKDYEKPPTIVIPLQPRSGNPPTDPFPTTDGGWYAHAIRQAPRGFTIAQRDYLKIVADNSALEEFRILARAREMDFVAAYWDITPTTAFINLPIPRYAPLRLAANADIAQAALDFADGRPQDAERKIREVISVGFLMIREAHLWIESTFGVVLVSSGRAALAALYQSTGKAAQARFVSSETDPDITAQDQPRSRPDLEELQRRLRTMIMDTAMLPGLRWEQLVLQMPVEPCTDLHQVVFGPDSLHVATLEEARRTLVRRPSDSLFFSLAERSVVLPITAKKSRGAMVKATRPVTAAISAVTGNRQLEGCLSLFGYY